MVFRSYGPINLCFAEQTSIFRGITNHRKLRKAGFLPDLTAEPQVFKFLDADGNIVFNICPSRSITRLWLIISGVLKAKIFAFERQLQDESK
jgi:hypothetical protein